MYSFCPPSFSCLLRHCHHSCDKLDQFVFLHLLLLVACFPSSSSSCCLFACTLTASKVHSVSFPYHSSLIPKIYHLTPLPHNLIPIPLQSHSQNTPVSLPYHTISFPYHSSLVPIPVPDFISQDTAGSKPGYLTPCNQANQGVVPASRLLTNESVVTKTGILILHMHMYRFSFSV